jgi:hypothetical protein
MRLVNALCRFVEVAGEQTGRPDLMTVMATGPLTLWGDQDLAW